MGVARFQSSGRPIKEQVGHMASGVGRPIAVAAFLLVLIGAAGSAHNEALEIHTGDPPVSDSGAAGSASEIAVSWAGFGGVAINEMLSRRLQLPSAGGVIITFVHPEGPAARAGLQSKDLILQADSEPITDGTAWSGWVAAQAPGTRIELSVWRQGEALSVPLTIEELPANVEPDQR